MKKTIALFLALVMLLSLAACSKKEETPKTQEAETEPAQIEEGLTVHENTFFDVGYDEEDGWVIEEDDVYVGEDGGSVYLRVLDADGYSEKYVNISAYEEDQEGFREDLYSYGYDEKTYVDGGYDPIVIGGQELLRDDTDYEDSCSFFGRNEPAGVTFEINTDAYDDPAVKKVLENLVFHVEDVGNEDGPWYWEGEPFSGGILSPMVGTYTLTAEFIPAAEPIITHETFNHDVEVADGKVYMLNDNVFNVYDFDGTTLSFAEEIALDGEYEVIERAEDGTLILSSFMEPTIGHNGETKLFSHEGPSYFATAPDGTWGISYFVGPDDVCKYTIGSGLTQEPFDVSAELGSTGYVRIDESYVYVAGSSASDDSHRLYVYDHAGALQYTLDDADGSGLGSITFAAKTENGFIAFDGNMREVVLWDNDGAYIGAVDSEDLFGAYYPWYCAADVLPDGSILCIMTEDRADESAMELIAFRVSGF